MHKKSKPMHKMTSNTAQQIGYKRKQARLNYRACTKGCSTALTWVQQTQITDLKLSTGHKNM
jgi:hypothetical protein